MVHMHLHTLRIYISY